MLIIAWPRDRREVGILVDKLCEYFETNGFSQQRSVNFKNMVHKIPRERSLLLAGVSCSITSCTPLRYAFDKWHIEQENQDGWFIEMKCRNILILGLGAYAKIKSTMFNIEF